MKDAYYFPHDSNARNDQRIIKLRRKYGAEGVGIYWMIVEILREQKDYRLGIDDDTIENIAFDLRVEQDKLEDVILHFDLFQRDDGDDFGSFYSNSLKRRMEKLDLIKQKRAVAGQKGGKSKANDKQMLSNSKASKVKKNTVKKIKEDNMQTQYAFDLFWNKYDLKLLRPDCELIWNGERKNKRGIKFDDTIRKAIMDHLDVYVKHTSKNGTYPSRKHPRTYLNNNSWKDEVIIAETKGDDYL